jgi:hypothetical protein
VFAPLLADLIDSRNDLVPHDLTRLERGTAMTSNPADPPTPVVTAAACRYADHGEMQRCPIHGCPICFTDWFGSGDCPTCDEAVRCRNDPDHLNMRRCPVHGSPGCFDAEDGGCENCAELVRFAAICDDQAHEGTQRCSEHGCPGCFTDRYGSGDCPDCDEAVRCRKHPDHLNMRRCPMHGCPGCSTADAVGCDNCAELVRFAAICTYHGHKDMQRCSEHGCPGCFTDDWGGGECPDCDQQMRLQYARDWPEAVVNRETGHDGEDCCHCTVCGKCQGTGQVCRWCQRCPEHQQEMGADCEQTRWDRFVRAERTYWVHSTFDKTTRRWSP